MAKFGWFGAYNPFGLLDEVDKPGPDFPGDLATTRLEVSVPRHLAIYTGRFTLQGRGSRWGQIKEKLLAVSRLGIRTILIPDPNRVGLENLVAPARKKCTFVPMDTVDHLLNVTPDRTALAKLLL